MARRPFYFLPARLRLILLLLFFFCAGRVQAQFSFNTVASICGTPTGSINVIINYGTGPYWLYLDGNGPTIINTNTYTFTNLIGDAAGAPYSITAYDQNGLGAPVVGVVALGDLAGPSILTNIKAATCLNDDGAITISQTGGNGPFFYSLNGGSFSANETFSGLATSPPSYTATVKDFNGCTSSAVVAVPLQNDLILTTFDPLPVCEGTALPLPATSNGDHFSWTPTAGLSDPTILNPLATPSTSTTYTISATRGICTRTAMTLITISPAPIPNAGADIQTCYGKTVVLRGSGGKFYHWSPSTGLTNPNVPLPIVLKPTSTITYSLSVTDANGCNSLQPDSVTVFVTPPLQVVAGPDTTVSAGQPVKLFAAGPPDPNGLSYEWSPATGLDDPLSATPTATLTSPQEISYVVEVTTGVGCTGKDTVVIKVLGVTDILVPNAFSPNNDGHNDILRPITPGIRTLKYFTVFDRWGRQVFTTSNPGVGWDGTLKGRVLETGVYVWMAMGVDVNGKVVERKGTVILVR
jgi:gliding motility-associated-like protein